jgi:TM2 domain-containing membrane protein YozV
MKKLMVVVLLIVVTGTAGAAEDRTLVGSIYHHGAFIAPVLKATEMKGQLTLLAGGRLAWVANHRFCLGVGGYGLLSDVETDFGGTGPTALLNFGYGGLEVEYIFYPHHMFHFTVWSLVGAGGADFFSREEGVELEWDGDAFFIVEPGFNLELNIREGWRLDFGYSYRFVSDLQMEGLSNKDLRDVAANLVLRLGKF